MSFSASTFGRFTGRYLMIFGAFFVVLGVGMAFALGSIPFAGGTMLLTGGLFAVIGAACIVIGFVINRRAAATEQVLTSGVAGTATITGVTQTGMYLNEQPRIKMNLLVQLPGQVPYSAEHSEFVPLILLPRVQPGASLPVRVDPALPQKVAIDWQASTNTLFAQGMAGMPGMMPAAPMVGMPAAAPPSASGVDESLAQVQAAMAGSGAAVPAAYATPDQGNYTIEQLRAWLRANGVAAQARVDFLEDSGRIVGDERLYTMEMTLMVPGSSPEKLTRSAAMVPLTAMHKIARGMTLPVKVAADNHQLLTVEWDKV